MPPDIRGTIDDFQNGSELQIPKIGSQLWSLNAAVHPEFRDLLCLLQHWTDGRCDPPFGLPDPSGTFSQIAPSLASDGKALGAYHPVVDLRLFPVVRFNEFQEGFFISLGGIANAAPEPAWVKLTRVC